MNSKNQEIWNTLTHGIGFISSLFAFVYLVLISIDYPAPFGSISAVTFGFSLILLYAASTMYHYNCYRNTKYLHHFQVFDHISIYILIAGTYTPFSILILWDGNGKIILITIWLLAILGSLFKIYYIGKYRWLSLAFYIGMGWLIIFDIKNVIDSTPSETLLYIFFGGAAYTLGAIIYSLKKISFSHLLWHLFVMTGSFFHFLSVKSLFIK